MKTQINDFVQGSQFVVGTDNAIRDARGEQVLKENGENITLRFTTERGSVDVTLNRYVSRSGKSWSYISPAISDADVAVLTGLDMSIYKYLHNVEVILYHDMRCEMNIYARKSENNPWSSATAPSWTIQSLQFFNHHGSRKTEKRRAAAQVCRSR